MTQQNNNDNNNNNINNNTTNRDMFAAFEVKARLALHAIHAMPIDAQQVLKDTYRPSYVTYTDGQGASSVHTLNEFAAWLANQLGAFSPGSVLPYLDDIAFVTAWWTYFRYPLQPMPGSFDYTERAHYDNLGDVFAVIKEEFCIG